jgi:hypothetical protein
MKKYLGGLFAIVLAVAMTAFTLPGASSPKTLQWYVFNGGDPSMAGNYTLAPGGANPNCPVQPTTVCAIEANAGTGSHPSQSDLNGIKTASDNFTKQAAHLEYLRP